MKRHTERRFLLLLVLLLCALALAKTQFYLAACQSSEGALSANYGSLLLAHRQYGADGPRRHRRSQSCAGSSHQA